MYRTIVAITAVLTSASWAPAQLATLRPCPDYIEHITALLSDDEKTRLAADAQMRAGECIAELYTKDPRLIEASIFPLLRRGLNSRDEQIRLHATGMASLLSMFRPDGAVLLAPLLPELEKRFKDSARRVRLNAVLAVVNMKPAPPVAAAEALAGELGEEDAHIRDSVFHGLVRIAPMPEWVPEKLITALDQTSDPGAEGRLLRAFGTISDLRPEILEALVTSLRSEEKPVVEGAIAALSQLGPRAALASSEVRRLAATTKDETLRRSAEAVAQRLETPKGEWPQK